MAAPLDLTLGFARTPFTEAFFVGDVQPQGIRLTPLSEFSEGLDNTGERHRQILGGQLAGGECSTSSFFLARTRGVPLKAIPVFPARGFPHRQIYCHSEAPIRTPADLAGKRVTVHRWNSTSPSWTKGILQNEYGVNLRSIHWFTAEPDPEGEGAPSDFEINRIPEPASREKAVEMLAAGQLDAGLDPYIRPGPGIRRVLDNWQQEAAGFFHRTGIFPMSHTVVLRESLLDEHPWIVESLVDTFRAAARAGARYLTDEGKAHDDWLREVVGEDPHAFHFGPIERKTLNELVRYQFQQGLRTEPLDVEAVFVINGNWAGAASQKGTLDMSGAD